MQKIIFLDVDGVLNVQSDTYYSHSWKVLGHDPIEPHLMARLEYIMERVPDSFIVVSSSWGKKKLIRRLIQSRFKYIDRIIDSTPRDVQPRANQIQVWIDENKPDSYIIIEDEVGMERELFSPDIIIDVDMNEGLSNANTINSVIGLNQLQDNDGVVCEFTRINYEKYYKLGYRPQVSVTNENGFVDFMELRKSWDTITICNRSLHMLLKKY